MNSVFFLALRRLRGPLILLVLIYAVSIAGLTLISGVDADGKPTPPMSIFHAFYFMSYTATTIGFGEIPYAFSNAQRLWATFCIYLSVVGWSYAILVLLALFQDKAFRQALTTRYFERRVERLAEPFYLICGYGETGALVCHALDRLGLRLVVLDKDEARLNELELQDFTADELSLLGDAASPETLLLAGLKHRYCQGVIALADDDAANLAVGITVQLLNPQIPILGRAETRETMANMASFGVDHIINSADKFAEHIVLAMQSPGGYRLLEWLTGAPGASLRAEAQPPRGRWLICGYGRFGRALADDFEQQRLPFTIIAPNPDITDGRDYVTGLGTEAATLMKARIEDAVGLVAGTDNDMHNLSIAITARELNPYLFLVLRQNSQYNQLLFGAFQADMTMALSEILAHECMAILTTPLLNRFLSYVKEQDDAWADAVIERLQTVIGDNVPTIWTVSLTSIEAPGLNWSLTAGDRRLTLDALLRNPSHRDEYLPCVPLLLVRQGRELILPQADTPLLAKDQALFAGAPPARALQNLTLQNVNVSDYVRFGKDIPGGWVWQWFNRRFANSAAKRQNRIPSP